MKYALLTFLFISATCSAQVNVLIFSKTEGYRHAAIEAGINAIKTLGTKINFSVEASEDASVFIEKGLQVFGAIIFLNTTGNVLNATQEKAFVNYIQSGGGFVGIHAATDTEYDWPWYGRLVGGYFNGHPQIQTAHVIRMDSMPESTRHLPWQWIREDEWYNFKDLNPNIEVLLTLDEQSYEGGTNGEYHPIAWYHEYEGGRAFYTGMGHTPESYEEEFFLKHLLEGIKYVIND